MKYKFSKIITVVLFLIFSEAKIVYSESIKEFKIIGNDRIPSETIIMFSGIKTNDFVSTNELNKVLKKLYNTNFFENISINIVENVVEIKVKENPIIEKISYDGIKSNKINQLIKDNSTLRSRSSYNELSLKKDLENIKFVLKELGYYFPIIDTYVENLNENKVNITYQIALGEKAKIKKISFIGDKKFKDRKLKSIIISEENKFWKFVTNKKFVNQRIIELDKRLLKNYYLNKGYYNVVVDSSFAKLVNEKDFELIYNIQANEKYYFNDLKISLPNNFDKKILFH